MNKQVLFGILGGCIFLCVLGILGVSIATLVKVYKKDKSDDGSSTIAKDITTVGGINTTAGITTTTTTVPNQYTNGVIDSSNEYAASYKQVADMFRETVKTSADPCDDFYSYVCGNIKDYNAFARLDDANINLLNDKIMDPSYRNSNVPKPVKQLFIYHNICKDASEYWYSKVVRNGTYIKSKMELFKNVTGLNFPLMEQSSPDPVEINKTTLAKAIGVIDGRFGNPSLLASYADTDYKNPDGPGLISVDQSILRYADVFYQKAWDDIKDDYKDSIMYWMKLLDRSLNDTILAKDADDMISLEYEIAININTREEDRRNYTRQYNPYTIEEASNQFPFLDWTAYLTEVFHYASPGVKQLISPTFKFLINEKEALAKLANAIATKFTPRTIINYLNYRVVVAYGPFLPFTSLRDRRPLPKNGLLDQTYKIQHVGKPRRPIRKPIIKAVDDYNIMCSVETMDYLPYSNGRVFVDALYKDEAARTYLRTSVANMIETVVVAFRSMIDELRWLNDASRKGAYSKIDNLVRNVAYPDFIMNDTLLTEYYEGLEFFETDSYTDVQEKWIEHEIRVAYDLLIINGTKRDDFYGPPALVNAWYQPLFNSITLPAAILQQPFYDPKWPVSVNYGSLGSIVGHELTHGFDDQGVQWDGVGKLAPWMDSSSYTAFLDMAQCVIDEYGKFCPLSTGDPESDCVDGWQTQGENIADNGGVQAAYRAYRNYVALNGLDPLLNDPIMRYFNHDQLFFMGYASSWCQTTPDEEELFSQMLLDVHSPSLYRVIGPLKNFPAFQIAFNCPDGKEYAPVDHCDVWVSDVVGEIGIPERQIANRRKNVTKRLL